MECLVVAQDHGMAHGIGQGLEAMGHRTVLVASGGEALALCARRAFDAAVIERSLPDIGGIAVIGELAQMPSPPPVLLVAGRGSVRERVEGLRAGADDCMVAPFDMEELEARLMAIARRSRRAGAGDTGGVVLHVGQLRLDAAGHRAMLGEASVGLNRREFSLLAFLMRHADRVVSRAMLLEAVWNYGFEPETNIVESNLSRLRARLLRLGCDPVRTRRGEGYELCSDRCG